MTERVQFADVEVIDADAALFTVSIAAELAGMHPQTLRTYDRLGLVQPQRTSGRGRRYSRRDISKLRLIQRLSQEEGINLEGIRRILTLQAELDDAQRRVDELTALVGELTSRSPGRRVFTAGSTGFVAQGRYTLRPVAEITSGE